MFDNSVRNREAAIVITNVDMHTRVADIILQLQDAGIEFSHVTKNQGSQRALVFFQTADSLEHTATLIRTLKAPISKQFYTCYIVSNGVTSVLPDRDGTIDQPNKSRQPTNFSPSKCTNVQPQMTILQAVAPYYSDDAEDELQAKSKLIRNAIKNQLTKLYKTYKNTGAIPLWAKNTEYTAHLRQPVPVYSPPLLTDYRSKVEFTIGWADSISDHSDRSTLPTNSTYDNTPSPSTIAVGPCIRHGKRITIFGSNKLHEANIFPPVTVKLSAILETVLSEAFASKYLLNDDLSMFSTLTIRCTGNVSASYFDITHLLIGVFLRIDLPTMDVTINGLHQSENNISLPPSYMTNDAASGYKIALEKAWPLILKFRDSVTEALKDNYYTVFYVKTTTVQKGSPHLDRYYAITTPITETNSSTFYITQDLYDLTFRIGPETFFQSNIATFKMLLEYVSNAVVTMLKQCYVTCRENMTDASSHLSVDLLDICCGSGVIGQCIASIVLKKMMNCNNLHINVKGIDCSQDAIKNAEFNASKNFKNNHSVSIAYACNKVEHSSEYFSGAAKIGILDPPRTGIFQSVLTAIRHSTLEYLIYISCNPKTMSQNIINLSIVSTDSNSSKHTTPFYVESLVGFNMFPGCDHVETVAILHRCPDLKGSLPMTTLSSDINI